MTARLNVIVETINELYKEVVKILEAAQEPATKIGELLTEARQIVDQSEWVQWLAENFQFSENTARNYINAFENYPFTALIDITNTYNMDAETMLNIDAMFARGELTEEETLLIVTSAEQLQKAWGELAARLKATGPPIP